MDFGNLAANFGKSGKVWDQGDLNYDGVVNSVDFGLLAGNFGKSASGAAVALSSADWAAWTPLPPPTACWRMSLNRSMPAPWAWELWDSSRAGAATEGTGRAIEPSTYDR